MPSTTSRRNIHVYVHVEKINTYRACCMITCIYDHVVCHFWLFVILSNEWWLFFCELIIQVYQNFCLQFFLTKYKVKKIVNFFNSQKLQRKIGGTCSWTQCCAEYTPFIQQYESPFYSIKQHLTGITVVYRVV